MHRKACLTLVGLLLVAWKAQAQTAAASAAAPGTAAAGEHPEPGRALRVVLVTNQADARIMPLLKAELEKLDFEVVVVDHGENEVVPRDLSIAARATNSLAGFRVIVAEKSVEVWLADRVTGKVVLREALEQDQESRGAESVVVLRAVELLRVSLMELEAPHEPRGDVPPPPELRKIAGFPEEKARYAIEIGGVVSWLSSDLPVLPGGQLVFRMDIGNWLHWGVLAGTDFASGSVRAEAGSASFETTNFGAFVGVHRSDGTAFLQPSLRVGPGLMWSRVEGRANAGFEEFTHAIWSATAMADARLAFRATNALRLFGSVASAVPFGRPAVEIDEKKVLRLSPVSLRFAAGLQVAWP